MSTFARGARAVIGLAGVLLGTVAIGADGAGIEAKAAFERLKSLAGEWTFEASGGKQTAKVVYRVTSNGSVVMETLFAGTDHEMVSMYHVDGSALRMTHYCAAGNQPRMKLDAKASSPDLLIFDFDGGTNLDPAKDMHMHSGRIRFLDGGRVEAEWDGYNNGKKVGSHKLSMKRS